MSDKRTRRIDVDGCHNCAKDVADCDMNWKPIIDKGCNNCAHSRGSITTCYECTTVYSKWTPDRMTKLGIHIDEASIERFSSGKNVFDVRKFRVWFILLEKLYADVQEAYRRD